MKVGIIGLGMVGSAVRHGMKHIGHEVFAHDIKLPETSLRDVLGTEIVFICVPTPPAADGRCDTSIVKKVVAELAGAGYRGLVTVKSTVEPGTTDTLQKLYPDLRLAFCPEFLREKAQYVDFVEYHHVCIIGAHTDGDYRTVCEAHGSLPKHFAKMTPLEAELSKYFWNVFNALRIVFANQFYDVTAAVGADYKTIKNALAKHPNIPDVYLQVNDNFRGFAGNCLPKDTLAFAQYAKDKLDPSLGLSLFDGIVEINRRYKPTVL